MAQMHQPIPSDVHARMRNAGNGPAQVRTSVRIRNAGTLIVLAHLAIVLVHGSGHTHLGIGTNRWQTVFIAIVILAGPLLSMVLLWTRLQRAGSLLLGVTMAGALAFGLYYHFIAPGADNALELGQSGWSTVFLITSVLLAIVEAMGFVWSVLALRSGMRP